MTISQQLVAFVRRMQGIGLPGDVQEEAKRLLLNQLKASVGATSHVAVKTLHDWSLEEARSHGGAHVLWFGSRTSAERAAVVNGALFEVLDFNDTYIPTFLHATSGLLPPLLACAESGQYTGGQVLDALALGLEVELACATLLMPTGYYRGFVPGGLVGGIGAAAACSILAGLDDEKMCNALGFAMCTAFGIYEAVGSSALPYIVGMTARSGLTAFEMARRGLESPVTAFEGEKGMLSSYSDESSSKFDAVMDSLGSTWRIHGQSYKTMPTETITHAPIECALEVLARIGEREVRRMRFYVEPIVAKIADERMQRFGNPSSELTARFDLRYCVAAAWLRGRFTLAEMEPAAYTDPTILELRSRIDLIADSGRKTFDGARLEVEYADGSVQGSNVDAFLGSPGLKLTNQQLSDVFRSSARGLLNAEHIEEILDAVWRLHEAPNIDRLLSLLTFH